MPFVHERDCALFNAPPGQVLTSVCVCVCGWPDTPCQLQAEHQRDTDEYREEMSIGGLPYGREND